MYYLRYNSYGGYDCMSSAHLIMGSDITSNIEIMCQCSVLNKEHEAHDECPKGKELAERIVGLLNANPNYLHL